MAPVESAVAQKADELRSTPLAQAFGAAPVMWGMQLSPDGTKFSAIQMHPSGFTFARVVSFVDGSSTTLLTGSDEVRVTWCEWANHERLLCGLGGLTRYANSDYFPVTRLVAANFDGSDVKSLVDDRLEDVRIAQYQDRIVDWLPDDEEHVLVQEPANDGEGVSRLNIYTGSLSPYERPRPNARVWLSDGHGTPRVYLNVAERARHWVVRDAPDAPWAALHSRDVEDLTDPFWPVGFAESRSDLLVFDRHEGRRALFAYDLANNRERRLVYSNPSFDLADVYRLGKYNRVVAATYIDDRPRMHFFDTRLEEVHDALSPAFAGKAVTVIDESWDQRYYLVFVSSATDPGTYYRYDATDSKVVRIGATYPSLANRELAPMRPVRYPADDGVEIPAYLTLPPGQSGPAPAIILPHGGPSARDYWSYDYLAQYLAAQGYAVLQSNYRGSDGYGAD